MVGGDADGVRARDAAASRSWARRRAAGRAGRGPAHEDGEPGRDRGLDARRPSSRSRTPRRPGSTSSDARSARGWRRELVAGEPRAADPGGRLRAGLLREALREGPAHRPRCGRAIGLDLPGLALAKRLYERLEAGGADLGTQALWLLYERGEHRSSTAVAVRHARVRCRERESRRGTTWGTAWVRV